MNQNLKFGTDSLFIAKKVHLDILTDVGTRAFCEYPLWKYFIPEDHKRFKKARYAFKTAINYGIHFGKVYYLPEFVGLMFILPSEHVPMNVSGLIRTGGLRTLRAGFSFLSKSIKVDKLTGESHHRVITDRHIYLQMLAVDPEHQGKKLGSKLMHPLLNFCDNENQICYLETHDPINVPKYIHYGFETKDEFKFPNTEINHWGMIRYPKKS